MSDVAELPVEPPPPDADDAAYAAWFRKLLLTVPRIQRAGITLQAASKVPVPLFYQDLALLIREGLFTTLMTTAFDALLSRSLASAGLHPDRDFRVLDVSEDMDKPETPPPPPGVVRVLKLHGSRPADSGELVRAAFTGPIVVVGYEATDPPLDEALGVPGGGPVWWVMAEVEPDHPLDAIRAAGRELTLIDGDAGDPDRFLGELTMDFFQPDLAFDPARVSDISGWQPADGRGGLSAALVQFAGTIEPDADGFERTYVKSRLHRARERLAAFEYQAAGGTSNRELEQQLRYQRRAVAELEERKRALDAGRDALVELLSELESALGASADPAAVEFVATLRTRMADELAKDDPQEGLVSAMLASAVTLADAAGVDRSLVTRLAELTPTTERTAP